MTVTTEKLLAYLDGQLPLEEMKSVEAAVAADPALRRQLDIQHKLAGTLQSAFAPVLDAPLPQRLLDAVRKHAAKPAWHERLTRTLREGFADRPLLSGSATAAAALAMGLVLGVFAWRPQGGDFMAGPQGLVAHAGLAKTLDRQLASNQALGAPQTVGLTFRNGKGDYCRTFTAAGSAGVACRENQAWHVVALTAVPLQAAQTGYRMAGSELPDVIRYTVRDMIAGTVLDAASERRARDSGWAAKN